MLWAGLDNQCVHRYMTCTTFLFLTSEKAADGGRAHLGQFEVAVLRAKKEGADCVDLHGAHIVKLGSHGPRQHGQAIIYFVAAQPPQLVHQIPRLHGR